MYEHVLESRGTCPAIIKYAVFFLKFERFIFIWEEYFERFVKQHTVVLIICGNTCLVYA